MKTDDLLDAIGKIDSRFVKEAEAPSDYEEIKEHKKPLRLQWKIWLSAAACFGLLVIGVTYGSLRLQRADESSASSADAAAGSASNTVKFGSTGNGDDTSKDGGSIAKEENDGNQDKTADSGSTAAGQVAAEDAEQEAAEDTRNEDEVCINEINQLNGMEICMAEPENVTEMSLAEAEAYYGLRLMPKVLPEGISYDDTSVLSVSYTEDGSVMDDNNTLRFRDASGEERLTIQARTTESGNITEFADDNLKASVIAGTTLTIGHDMWQKDTDFYIAIYQKGEVTVTVQGTGITEDEMLAVLHSLLVQ
jgi:hypothetical protein